MSAAITRHDEVKDFASRIIDNTCADARIEIAGRNGSGVHHLDGFRRGEYDFIGICGALTSAPPL